MRIHYVFLDDDTNKEDLKECKKLKKQVALKIKKIPITSKIEKGHYLSINNYKYDSNEDLYEVISVNDNFDGDTDNYKIIVIHSEILRFVRMWK